MDRNRHTLHIRSLLAVIAVTISSIYRINYDIAHTYPLLCFIVDCRPEIRVSDPCLSLVDPDPDPTSDMDGFKSWVRIENLNTLRNIFCKINLIFKNCFKKLGWTLDPDKTYGSDRIRIRNSARNSTIRPSYLFAGRATCRYILIKSHRQTC